MGVDNPRFLCKLVQSWKESYQHRPFAPWFLKMLTVKVGFVLFCFVLNFSLFCFKRDNPCPWKESYQQRPFAPWFLKILTVKVLLLF